MTSGAAPLPRREPDGSDLPTAFVDRAVALVRGGGHADAGGGPPRTVGPYRVVRELGRGGQGAVYLAEDARLRRAVALKVLYGYRAATRAALDRFHREALIASRLDHPGICTVYDVGTHEGTPYLAMRFVEGTTLAQRIREELDAATTELVTVEEGATETPPLRRPDATPAQAPDRRAVDAFVRIVEKAARALHAAHELGVVHRDVKPANVMVTPSCEPVLLDFGLARDFGGDDATITRAGELFGTPAYMSPEQILGARVDRRTDVYSLGVTLYECVTLQRPFEAPTRQELNRQILHKHAPDPRRLNGAVSRDLGVVLATAMAKEPDRRYRTAAGFADDLARCLARRPVRARPIPLAARAVLWARRRPAHAALVALTLLVAALGGFLAARWPEIREADRMALAAEVETELEAGYRELGEGSLDVARSALERALALDADTPEAVAGLVLAGILAGDPEGAAAVLGRHRTTAESHPELDWLRVELLRVQGEDERAAALQQELAGRTSGAPRSALAHFMLGVWHMAAGHRGRAGAFEEAGTHLLSAVLRSPRPRALHHFMLAHASGHAGDASLARQTASALLRLWPDSAQAWTWAGFALHPHDGPAGLELLQGAVARDPQSGIARFHLAVALKAAGRAADARAELERSLDLRPDLVQARLNLANVLVGEGAHDRARRLLEEVLEDAPDLWQAHVSLGRLHLHEGERGDAVEAFRAAVRRSASARPREALAGTLVEMGEAAAALPVARDAVERDGDSRGARLVLGRALRRSGDAEGAVDVLEEAVARWPNAPDLLLELGLARQAEGDLDGAEAAYRSAAEHAPSDLEPPNNLAIVLAAKGDAAGAVAVLEKTVERAPGSARTWYNLARALLAARRPDRAREAAVRATALDQDLLEAWLLLGFLRQQGADLEGAVAAYDHAATLAPGDASIHYNRGCALMKLGRADAALAACRTAVRLREDHAEAWCNLGLVLERKGRFVEALEALEKGHALGTARAEWSVPSERWLDRVRPLAARERRVEAVRNGAAAEPAELVRLAPFASSMGLHALAVGWWRRAFEEAPELFEVEGARHRYRAARDALAAAGAASGEDAEALRRDALAWLEAELLRVEAVVAGGGSRRAARRELERWEADDALAPVRGPGLRRLDDAEREQWEGLWLRHGDLLAELGG